MQLERLAEIRSVATPKRRDGYGGLAETMRRNRLFEVVMAATAELHSVFDAERRLSYANSAFLSLWGKSLEDAYGLSLLELGCAPWHAEMHGCEIDQVVRTQEPVRGEVGFAGAVTAEIRVYQYTMVPVVGAAGEVEAVCLTMLDITERKRATERALMVAKLAQQLASLPSEEEIIRHVVESVGRVLGAHRCYFAESQQGSSRLTVSENWVRDKSPSLAGTVSGDAGVADWAAWYFTGLAVCEDVRSHPVTQHRASQFEAFQVSSYVVQPVKRDGQQTVVLVVTENVARPWTAEDLRLLEAVAGCAWPLVEQMRMQRRLREAENRMRLVSDHVPGLIKYVGRDLCIQFSNRDLAEGLGAQVDGMRGVHLRTALGEESYQQRLPFLQRALAGEAVKFKGSLHHQVEGPQVLDITYVPDFDSSGVVQGIYALGLDVTEQERTREALASHSERLRLLWACARVLLTTDDPDTMLHRLFSEIGGNLGADAFFNFVVESPGGETLRLRSWRGITDAQADMLSQIGFNVGACGEVARTRRPVVRSIAAEGLGLCAYAGYPLMNDGQLLGTLGFASRSKQAFSSDELEFIEILSHYVTAAYVRLELMASLRESDRRKDEFLATLAHELRNPLAPICTGVEVLRQLKNSPEQTVEVVGIIERQALQMVRLIDDLVDVSRITRGKMQLNRTAVELGTILGSALETAKPLIDSGGHEVFVLNDYGSIVLHADAGRLSQVFSNLLNNAARYTPDGGRIEVTVEPAESSVRVVIRDNGEGIDPPLQDQIFEMFTQLSRSGRSATEGLGIGLGLVRQLVEMHGGAIEVFSEGLGEGSEFRVTLPLANPPAAEDDPAVLAAPSSSQITKVLVVDDGACAADMLAMFLELEGYEARTAYDGVHALEVAAEFGPQVVFLDLGMPRLNGFETARRMRQLPGCREILLIALTGWGQDSDRRKTEQAGFDHHLVKPIEPRVLREMLAELTLKPAMPNHPRIASN